MPWFFRLASRAALLAVGSEVAECVRQLESREARAP